MTVRKWSIWLLLFLLFALSSTARTEPGAAPAESWSDLRSQLESIVHSRCVSPSRLGVHVVRLGDGTEFFSHNPDLSLKPASNLKLLTAAAALSRLKPDYLFPTVFYTLKPLRNGVVEGDLYIKGFGAPDLVGEFWWLMVQELYRQGLREIKGNVIGDDTYFDQESRPAAWPEPAGDSWFSAPVGALSFNYDVVTIRVRPGSALGHKPRVDLIPLGDYFEVKNQATTSRERSRLYVGRTFPNGVNTVSVRGHIREGGGSIEVTKGVEGPTGYALSAFRELATRQGIKIDGDLRRGSLPSGAREIFRFESKPLSAIVRDMNKHSNNFMAEAVLKTLGAEVLGVPGTTEKGIEVIMEYLEEIGVATTGVSLADGSGLAHGNRLTARSLVQILSSLHKDFEIGPEFLNSLPVAGSDGTLRKRFRKSGQQRRLRAKTGHLKGVESLTGYASNENGESFAFAILVNGTRCGTPDIKRVMDRFCGALIHNSLARPPEHDTSTLRKPTTGP